jgi:cephalosporin hydroxylase
MSSTSDSDAVSDPHDPSDRALAAKMGAELRTDFEDLINRSAPFRYTYNFRWLGRPIIQFPQDLVALQEIVWETRPEVVVETGIAHGGSLVFYASLLQLLGGDGFVLGVDIDIRQHNRTAIEAHPLAPRIKMIEGSSVDPAIVARVREAVGGRRTMVVLDSNHTGDHVLSELQLYSPLVSAGCYLVVLDTIVERMPKALFPDRPWGPGNNPMTAVDEFLKTTDQFVIDREIDDKLLFTVAPRGFLKRVKA